jgi:hypothetical protein
VNAPECRFNRYIFTLQCINNKILFMLGFGALRDMNDTTKQNRDLLKAKKKKPFEKMGYSTRISDNLLHNDKKLSDPERIQLIQATWQSNREETRRKILGLMVSIVIVGVLITIFIMWWTQYFG